MSKKQKMMRLIISGTLLAAVALVGISVYQVDVSQQERLEEMNEVAEAEDITPEEETELMQGGNSTAGQDDSEPHHAVIEDEEEEIPEAEDVASGEVTAQLDDQTGNVTAQIDNTAGNEATEQAEASVSDLDSDVTADAGNQQDAQNESDTTAQADTANETSVGVTTIVPDVNFSGELLMNWPVEGEILMDYSMDRSIYFETLNVYKYNPSILLGAQSGTPVEAAANMKVLSIEETLETGTTITADMGNGYQAVYGQLKDVKVAVDDVVAAGTVLGYVNEPTKYYTKEGSNLYFSMTKDGESVDPVLYLP